MHRFFVSADRITGNRVFIETEEARHITRVLRLKAGETVTVFDGMGHEYLVELQEQEGEGLTGQVIQKLARDHEPATRLHLVQGIIKGDKMDTVIQKAVEIGVKAIYPLAAERSVVRLEGDRAARRIGRWQDIAREACKQCRRNYIPRISPVLELPALLHEMAGHPVLMLYEKEAVLGLRQYLKERGTDLKGSDIFVLVGPEGGFSEAEVEKARNAGVATVSMGPRILRTETAGLVAAAIILYELEDLG